MGAHPQRQIQTVDHAPSSCPEDAQVPRDHQGLQPRDTPPDPHAQASWTRRCPVQAGSLGLGLGQGWVVLLARPPSPYQLGWWHCSFGSSNILLPTLTTPVPGSPVKPRAVQPTYTGPTYPVPTRLLSARRTRAHPLNYPWEPASRRDPHLGANLHGVLLVVVAGVGGELTSSPPSHPGHCVLWGSFSPGPKCNSLPVLV